jgi:hypothetical protein
MVVRAAQHVRLDRFGRIADQVWKDAAGDVLDGVSE